MGKQSLFLPRTVQKYNCILWSEGSVFECVGLVVSILTTRLLEFKGWRVTIPSTRQVYLVCRPASNVNLSVFITLRISQCQQSMHSAWNVIQSAVCVLTVKRRPAYYNNLIHVIVLSLNACSDGLAPQLLMQFDWRYFVT